MPFEKTGAVQTFTLNLSGKEMPDKFAFVRARPHSAIFINPQCRFQLRLVYQFQIGRSQIEDREQDRIDTLADYQNHRRNTILPLFEISVIWINSQPASVYPLDKNRKIITLTKLFSWYEFVKIWQTLTGFYSWEYLLKNKILYTAMAKDFFFFNVTST